MIEGTGAYQYFDKGNVVSAFTLCVYDRLDGTIAFGNTDHPKNIHLEVALTAAQVPTLVGQLQAWLRRQEADKKPA